MKRIIFTIGCLLFGHFHSLAAEIPVTPSDFASKYAAAANEDILLLSDGIYTTNITFPIGKIITIKAAEGALPVYTGTVNAPSISDFSGSGLIFDGVEINRNSDYFVDGNINGDITILAFRNLTIRNVNRCLLQTRTEGYTIGTIELTNCIVKDCGNNNYNLIWPRHVVQNVVVKNSTLYNYSNGESLFLPNHAANTNNVITFIFENNTVYKWARSSDRALCKTEGKYSSNSTYTFKNNIVTMPGIAGTSPQILQTSSGTVIGTNNLIVNYGGYTGGNRTINDLTLADLELESIGFPDPDNGDFTILASSPLATAGENGGPIGDPRWIKTIDALVLLTTTVAPPEAGRAVPISAAFEAGQPATVTAVNEYGYRFKEWQANGTTVSTQNPYTFIINADTDIVAIFEAIPTYTLTIHKIGDGAEWGKARLTPEPVNGVYEENTIVTITIQSNPVTSFLYWDDMSNELTKTVLVNENKLVTLTFDWVPFIVGWDFDPAEPRNNRQGDYYNQSNNRGIMRFFNGNGTPTNWGGSTRTFGATTYNCARRYTEATNMSNPRYFQAEFSARNYTTDHETVKYNAIHINSLIAADNVCVHRTQKMQYALNPAGPYIDLITIDMTDKLNQWIECNATLPSLTDAEKESIFIRWVGVPADGLLGVPSGTDTEGFYLANVFVFAELEEAPDDTPPVLISIIPENGSSTASANGAIVLTFNERIKAGVNEGRVVFNEKGIKPVFANRTISYPYAGLSYGTSYIFTLPAGIITDMSGNAFEGITITFSTMTRPKPTARLFDFVVAKDGSGDGTTIQSAFNAAPTNTARFLIFVKDGLYEEPLMLTKNNISLIGQSAENVIVRQRSNNGVSSTNAALVVRANNFYVENMTFQDPSGPIGPAPAHLDNGRFNTYKNVRLWGQQDTQVTGSDGLQYYQNCYIEGTVDFICGGGTMFYDRCTLFCLGSEVGRNSGSVITAPSTRATLQYGYVFSNCTIRGGIGQNGQYKLGRPWQNAARTVYINTTMIDLPSPEGWADMGTSPPALFAEYNSMDANGNPVDMSNRKKDFYRDGVYVGSSPKTVLTAEEAAQYTIENVLTNSWSPHAMTESADVPVISFVDGVIRWEPVEYAICYIILCENQVTHFTIDNTYTPASEDTNLEYAIYAVAESGALSVLSNTVTLNLKDDDEVIDIKVTPSEVSVQKGQTQKFNAEVTITGNASSEVEWAITGNSSNETVINNLGLLTVAINETAASLTVTATSKFDVAKSGSATVIIASLTNVELTETQFARLYPNPTDGIFSLEFDVPGDYVVTINNITGKVMSRQTVNNQLIHLDIGSFPAGLYLLVIDDGKRQSTIKIIKNVSQSF